MLTFVSYSNHSHTDSRTCSSTSGSASLTLMQKAWSTQKRSCVARYAHMFRQHCVTWLSWLAYRKTTTKTWKSSRLTLSAAARFSRSEATSGIWPTTQSNGSTYLPRNIYSSMQRMISGWSYQTCSMGFVVWSTSMKSSINKSLAASKNKKTRKKTSMMIPWTKTSPMKTMLDPRLLKRTMITTATMRTTTAMATLARETTKTMIRPMLAPRSQ
jgi:hypothetical protein